LFLNTWVDFRNGLSDAAALDAMIAAVQGVSGPVADRRAEMVSTYFVVGFAGNALSVIGVGVISSFVSPLAASIVFAVTIAVFAVVALIVARQYLSKQTAN